MPSNTSGATKPVNRWRSAKQVAKGGMAVSSTGVSVAGQALGVPNVALLAAGAAASATGIGLVVTGAALTLTASTLSAVSAHKSRLHRNALGEIQKRVNAYECWPLIDNNPDIESRQFTVQDAAEHQKLVDAVLPYAIAQKSSKYHRKVVGAVPVVGLLESVRAVGKKAYKMAKGTQGVERKAHARALASHLITHDCALAQAIVAELYSFEEMLWLKDQDYDEVVRLLEEKLKST